MPIYEYRCETCNERFERLFLSLKQIPAEIVCPSCQSTQVRRVMSAPAVHKTGEGGGTVEAADPAPTSSPVFGRKELNQAMEKKKQLRESVQAEKSK